jgi:OPT oligopeptide transporter protein
MSTQLIGFSIGGICKRFLVAPPSMIWPVNLVTAALFNTLHAQETSGNRTRGGISRGRFFTFVFFGYLLYSQFFFLRPGNWSLSRGPNLLLCYSRLPSLVSFHRSLEFLMDLLDGSQQRQSQPALWRHPWFGHGCSHLRLGSDFLQRLPSSCPLVGCGKRWRNHRNFLLVTLTHPLCETTLHFAFRVTLIF